VHTRSLPLADDVNLDRLAATTPGMVGADLANLANEAALTAARRNHEKVENADFTDALGRALHRPTLLPTPTPGLWVLFGREATREAILSGARVLPARLEASGFAWDEPQLDGAIRRALAH